MYSRTLKKCPKGLQATIHKIQRILSTQLPSFVHTPRTLGKDEVPKDMSFMIKAMMKFSKDSSIYLISMSRHCIDRSSGRKWDKAATRVDRFGNVNVGSRTRNAWRANSSAYDVSQGRAISTGVTKILFESIVIVCTTNITGES